jgi:hypothetical protein
MASTIINTSTRTGSTDCWTPTRRSKASMCVAVFQAAMNGGTIIIHPKSIAIRDRVGLIESSCWTIRSSSLIFHHQ